MIHAIVALIVLILFVLWVIFNFGVFWTALILNGIPILLISLRSYRDIRYYKEHELYLQSALIAAVIIAIFYSWFRSTSFFAVTWFFALTIAIVYIAKWLVVFGKKHGITDKLKSIIKKK